MDPGVGPPYSGTGKVPLWTEITTDFDPDEETANFGTRHALESEGNIYEVVTLSTIEASGHVTKHPSMKAKSIEDGVIMAIDSTLVFFTKDCQDVQTLVFESSLTALGVSQCGRFAVCGTDTGEMLFVHAPTRRVLASVPIAASQDSRELISADITGTADSAKLVLISKSTIFLFDGVDLKHLHTCIITGDMQALKAAQASLKLQHFQHQLEVVDCLTCCDMFNNCVILVAHSEGLASMVLDTGSQKAQIIDELDIEAFDGETIIRLLMNKDKTRLYCVDSAGRIHGVCYFTFSIIQTFSEVNVLEAVLLDEDDPMSSQFLITVLDPSGDRYFEMRSVRAFQQHYRLKVADFCLPMDHHESQDSIMIVEGTSEDVLRPNSIDKLRVRGITEGIPEVRLERILRRNKFTEAEKFADTFGLSKEDVYKRKIVWLLEKLSPWTLTADQKEIDEHFDELKSCLGKVEDLEFVIECCGIAALPSIDMTRKLLLFARDKISSTQQDGDVNARLVLHIGKTMHRLETYVTTHADRNIEEWIKFSRVNMLTKMKKTLEAGGMQEALLIWVRHQTEVRESLADTGEVLNILKCIPNQESIDAKLQFLRQFIPDILKLNPQSLPVLANWALDTVYLLEFDRKAWPDNGLRFAEQVLQTLQFGETDDYSQFLTILTLNQQRTEQDSSLSKLIYTVNLLKDLSHLKNEFKIRIKLADFMDSNKMNVISCILDWVMLPEEICPLITNFLANYILKHQLNQNKVLMDYILKLLGNTHYTWHWHVGSAPWEEKVAKLLPFISSTEEKACVVLEAVKQAPVPWSQTVMDICQVGCDLDHSAAVEIKEQRSLVSVKTILRKYECKSLVSHGRDGDRMLQYIILKGGEQGYQDVLEICKVLGTKSEVEVKKLYIDILIRNSQDSQAAIRLIQEACNASAPAKDGFELCKHVIEAARLAVSLQMSEPVETCYVQVLTSLLTCLDSKNEEFEEYSEKAENLLNAVTLKNKYNIITRETNSLSQEKSITDKENNKRLLKEYQSTNLKARPNNKTNVSQAVSGGASKNEGKPDCGVKLDDVMKICDLLGMRQEEGIARYMLELNQGGWYQESLEAGKILMKSSLDADLANSIFFVVYNTETELSQASLDANTTTTAVSQEDEEINLSTLPDLLASLTCHSLVECDECALLDTLELLNWQHLSTKMNDECHNRRSYANANINDVFDEWKFGNSYKDKGLPLEREDLLPNLCKNMTSILPLVEEQPYPYLPRNISTSIEVMNLDVTCPDLETSGTGINYREVSSDLHKGFLPIIQSLQMSGHGTLAIQSMELLQGCLDPLMQRTDPQFQGQTQKSLKDLGVGLIGQMVQRILLDAQSDPRLCLGLISGLDARTALTKLSQINTGLGQDFRKICTLASVGYQYCKMNQLPKQAEQFLELFVKSSWGKRSLQLEIPFKEAFMGSVKDRVTALEKMVMHPRMDVELVLQYAKAFKIDVDEALCLMSSALLTSMEPSILTTPNVDSKTSEIKLKVVDNTKVKDVLLRAWELFSNPDVWYQYLVKELNRISPYNYEGLEFVLYGIQMTGGARHQHAGGDTFGKASRILGFLMQYTRVSCPHPELEVDNWFKEHSTSFPKIGHKRLPLHGILNLGNKEKCKLLEKEFTLDTYRSWLLVSDFVGVSVNNICSYTVTNTVTKIVEQHKTASDSIGTGANKDEWIISHNNKCVLEELNACILQMKNPENGNAASNWIVNRLPRGADKVLAAKGNLRMAQIWMERNPNDEDCRLSLDYALKTKNQLETEQVLYRYKLADANYLECIEQNNPTELIHRLYEDPRILTRSKVAAGDYPDFAAAAEEIASINAMNHHAIKYQLLNRWLPQSNSCSMNSAANETFSDFNINLNGGLDGGSGSLGGEDSASDVESREDRDNLLRCIYVLQNGSVESVHYLLKIVQSDDPTVNTVHKLRALKCMFSIYGEDELDKISGQQSQQLKSFMKDLIFISRMEKLNLPVNVESFQTCNKSNLVEGIWRSCKHNKEGIVLVRDLCTEFSIWNTNLWSSLLSQMLKFNFIKELEKTLLVLCSQPQIWTCGQFISAWNHLLLSPFSSLLPPASEEQETTCREILSLVHHCPTVMDLKLDAIVEECFKTQLSHLALILVPYLSQENGAKVQQHVANQLTQEEMTSRIGKLRLAGVSLPANFATGKLNKKQELVTTSPAL